MRTEENPKGGAFAVRVREARTLGFNCTSCGAEIARALSSLGSVVCHECRPGTQSRDAVPAVTTVDVTNVGQHRVELRRELHRCRRYRRKLALLGMPLFTVEQHAALRSSLRALDTTWSEGSQAYVLLVESGREDADATVARLGGGTDPVLDLATTRVAVFPDDAMTVGALLAAVAVSREGALQTIDCANAGTTRSSPKVRLAGWFGPQGNPKRLKVSWIGRGGSPHQAPRPL